MAGNTRHGLPIWQRKFSFPNIGCRARLFIGCETVQPRGVLRAMSSDLTRLSTG